MTVCGENYLLYNTLPTETGTSWKKVYWNISCKCPNVGFNNILVFAFAIIQCSLLIKHRCNISDNATVVSEKDVVGLGDNDMTVNTYRLDFPGVAAYISLTSDTCVPVVETIRGSLDGSKFIFTPANRDVQN